MGMCRDGVISRKEWEDARMPAVVDGSISREEYLSRYHPELLQTGPPAPAPPLPAAPPAPPRAVREKSQPENYDLDGYGDDDLDLPEAFTYEDDFPVAPPRRTVTIDQDHCPPVLCFDEKGQDVVADFGFLDPAAGRPVARTDLEAAPHQHEQKPTGPLSALSARKPTKQSDSEYLAC